MSDQRTKQAKISKEEMIAHVKSIAARNEIILRLERPSGGKAYTTARPMRVVTQPITSKMSYLIALHELGHCLHQEALRLSRERGNQLICETLAWEWAIEASKIELDEPTKVRIGKALRSYREKWVSVAGSSRGTLTVNEPDSETYRKILGWVPAEKKKERFLP